MLLGEGLQQVAFGSFCMVRRYRPPCETGWAMIGDIRKVKGVGVLVNPPPFCSFYLSGSYTILPK